MEHGFYTSRARSLGLDIMVPDQEDRTTVHDIIFNRLCAGQILDRSRDKLFEIIERERARAPTASSSAAPRSA